MELVPKIFIAKVMHKRLFPKVNKFTYGVYYLFLSLSKLCSEFMLKNLAINKKGILSFYEKDHGNYGGNIEEWIRNILVKNKLNTITKEVVLVTLPRIFGYVFNPVSFWFCLDETENLIAVLAEVNNTFGETHSYLCTPKDGGIIKETDGLTVKKLFHVSPFLERNGSYQFRFLLKKKMALILAQLEIFLVWFMVSKMVMRLTGVMLWMYPSTTRFTD